MKDDVKNLLMKMACGIKTSYSVRDLFPEKTRFLLLNALVISHLHYSSVILNGITENLLTTLGKQLSWAVKACFNRNKLDHSSDLKIYHKTNYSGYQKPGANEQIVCEPPTRN